ncbi:MAG: tetratricopeptide repeat protein [Gemmataceae bacterium]|nr:tetratricopeptide repeat protein [Gemmataceae bacterium]
MDGRLLAGWVVVGGLPAPGTKPGAMTLPAPGGGHLPSGNPAAVATPEVLPARPKKTGPMPDFEAAAADTLLERAFADPPPANRDELLDTARLRYQRALKADAKHKGALLGLARMYARMGDRAKAVETYARYTKAYPKEADVPHEVAVAHARWGDWAGAAGWCDAALKLDPENRTFTKTKGLCLARAGRADEAVGLLVRVMPEAQARVAVAHALDDAGLFDASRQQLHLALRADPTFVPARDVLAELDGTAPPVAPVADPNPVVPVGHQEPR